MYSLDEKKSLGRRKNIWTTIRKNKEKQRKKTKDHCKQINEMHNSYYKNNNNKNLHWKYFKEGKNPNDFVSSLSKLKCARKKKAEQGYK